MRLALAAVVGIFAVATSACAGEPFEAYSIVLLDSASPELEATVVDAAKDWEASVHGLTLTVSREHAWERGRYHTMWISQVDEVPGAFIGYAAYEGMPGTGQLNFEPKGVNGHTVRHEIGHVMRLKHQPCGVMAEKYRPSVSPMTVQECDAAQYRAVWGYN